MKIISQPDSMPLEPEELDELIPPHYDATSTKEKYINALRLADQGDYSELIAFVLS